MKILRQRSTLEGHFRANPFRHIYEIGDLDDFFWPRTTWLASHNEQTVVLLYQAETPVILALGAAKASAALLEESIEHLPDRFYAHLTPGIPQGLKKLHCSKPNTHLKMALQRCPQEQPGVEWLEPRHQEELLDFYRQAYPDNWFDPRMLDTGHYVARREKGTLLAVAGVHVYSERYRVAALGNVATHPTARGRGLASLVTGALCARLAKTVDHIGLNVHSQNRTAIACYQRLGFEIHSEYLETLITQSL